MHRTPGLGSHRPRLGYAIAPLVVGWGENSVSLLSVCVLCAEVPELYEAEFFEHCVVGGKWLVLTAAVYNRLMYGSPLRPPECRGDLVDLMSVVIPL